MRNNNFSRATFAILSFTAFASCTKQAATPTNVVGDKELAMNACAQTVIDQKNEGCFDRVLHVPICNKTCVVVKEKKFHCGVKMEDPVEDTENVLCNENNTWNPIVRTQKTSEP